MSTLVFTTWLQLSTPLSTQYSLATSWAQVSLGRLGTGSSIGTPIQSHLFMLTMLSPRLFVSVVMFASSLPSPFPTCDGSNSFGAPAKSYGLSVNGLFLGALSHADDIRTLSTNLADCKKQISSIHSLISSCNVTFNANKCKAVISPSIPGNASSIRSDNIEIPISHAFSQMPWGLVVHLTLQQQTDWGECQKSKRSILCQRLWGVQWCSEPTIMHPGVPSNVAFCLFYCMVRSPGH